MEKLWHKFQVLYECQKPQHRFVNLDRYFDPVSRFLFYCETCLSRVPFALWFQWQKFYTHLGVCAFGDTDHHRIKSSGENFITLADIGQTFRKNFLFGTIPCITGIFETSPPSEVSIARSIVQTLREADRLLFLFEIMSNRKPFEVAEVHPKNFRYADPQSSSDWILAAKDITHLAQLADGKISIKLILVH